MPYLHGSGSAGFILKQADGSDLEGATGIEDGAFTKPISVPFALKGGGMLFEHGTVTAGGLQPTLQVCFDYDAATPSWVNVPNDANTTAACQFAATVGAANTTSFEWYGFHVPASWQKGSGDTTTTQQVGNVAMRVALGGAADTDVDVNLARLFLIKSVE